MPSMISPTPLQTDPCLPNQAQSSYSEKPKVAEDEFDIVSSYNSLLRSDPDLTMPVAAIESLVLALSTHPSSTFSETLTLLTTLTAKLKAGTPNPIALSAGTDLFQQYILASLTSSSSTNPRGHRSQSIVQDDPETEFEHIRTHLVQNVRLFVKRAKEARYRIAALGRHFVRDGYTVLTNGGSRVVGAMLASAAESKGGSNGCGGFRVIYVVNDAERVEGRGGRSTLGLGVVNENEPRKEKSGYRDAEYDADEESRENIAMLRRLGVPVAVVPPTAIAYCLDRVTACFVGAEGVMENGGVISRLGTYQMGMLAKAANKPFYVVAESHKFVRLYPLGQNDLGIDQNIVDFKADETRRSRSKSAAGLRDVSRPRGDSNPAIKDTNIKASLNTAVDFTPPHLISGIITETGVLLPSAVSEELIKIWF